MGLPRRDLLLLLAGVAAGSAGAYLLTRLARSSQRRKVERGPAAPPQGLEDPSPTAAAGQLAPTLRELAEEDKDEIIQEQFTRNVQMLGRSGQLSVHSAFVVVVGLGGVGSHAAAMLLRSGVGRLRIVDFDQVSLSSLNRHAVAERADVGTSKAECLRKHFLRILPEAQVEAIVAMYTEQTEDRVLEGDPDYVLDCIDNIDTKVSLLWACQRRGLRVLSSMGAGARADPTRIRVADVMESSVDPLSRAVRLRLRRLMASQGGSPEQQPGGGGDSPEDGAGGAAPGAEWGPSQDPQSQSSGEARARASPVGAPEGAKAGATEEGADSEGASMPRNSSPPAESEAGARQDNVGGEDGEQQQQEQKNHHHQRRGQHLEKGGKAGSAGAGDEEGARGKGKSAGGDEFLGIEAVFSLERPKSKLLPLATEDQDPRDFQVVPGFRVRVIPVLGTIPAIFGQVMATHVITRLAGMGVQMEPVVSLGHEHYRTLHQRLVEREEQRFGTADAVEVDLEDVVFAVREVWHGRSARQQQGRVLFGRAMWRSMGSMTLTRWDKSRPPSVDNLVLLTFDEADAHDEQSLAELAEAELEFVNSTSQRLSRSMEAY